MINTITVAPFTGGVFTPDSVVVLTLYKAYSYVDGTDTKYDWSEYESKTYTIKFPADGYYGPIIGTKATDITVNYGDTGTGIVYNGLDKAQVFGTRSAGNEITITVKTEGNNLNATRAKWTGHNNGNEFKMALVDAEGEDIFAANRNPAATHGGWNTPGSGNDTAVLNFKENPDAEYDVLAGDMQLEFSITWGNNDLVVHDGGAATVTFESITEWAGMEAIQDLLDDVADLVQSDYELRTATAQSPIHGTVTTVEAAWSVINNDVAALQGYLNGGSYANTKANRQNVINLAQDLVQVYQYLKVKAVTREDLQKAVDQAAEFKPAEDYTYESWKALSKALKKANKALASGLESDIAEAASALNAAIAGMRKEGEVDKAALKSAIAAAQALVEADYTAESWAANKAAIDDAVKAAQAVVDNAKATQSQVNTALNVLNGAMDKLVKKAPEGPKAPASGNGWVYDYATGDDYYFVNGKMVTNYWAGQSNGGSKWNLWYYLGSDGKLVKGFNYIVDDNGTGWYMLETGNGDTRGQMLTGWQKTGTAAGTGWFNTGRGADHGKCTYTSGWGDYSASTGMWADGLSHR